MKVLLTGAFKYTEAQLNSIENLGYEIVFVQDEREKLDIDVSDIEVVVCNGLFLYNDISEFKNLKVIQLTSAGMDRVPMDYIRENDIKIYNAKGVYSAPMAEWVISKVLEIYKKSGSFLEQQKNKVWNKHRDLIEITEKKVLIIGYGSVGSAVAKRLKAFDAYITAIDKKYIKDDYVDDSFLLNDLNNIIKDADIIILTLPLNQETKHLFNKSLLEKIKQGSVLINVSRGGIINEIDLINQIEDNKFLGLSLDVFETEPLPINSKLWNFDNVIITPHNSFASNKTQNRLFSLMFENLRRNIEEE